MELNRCGTVLGLVDLCTPKPCLVIEFDVNNVTLDFKHEYVPRYFATDVTGMGHTLNVISFNVSWHCVERSFLSTNVASAYWQSGYHFV